MALNLIESLRNTEAMGVWVMAPSSHVWCLRSRHWRKLFWKKLLRFLQREFLTSYTSFHYYRRAFSFSSNATPWGRRWLRRGTLTMKAEQSNQFQKQTGLWTIPCSQTSLIHMPLFQPSNVHETHFCIETSLFSSSLFMQVMCTLNFLSPPT